MQITLCQAERGALQNWARTRAISWTKQIPDTAPQSSSFVSKRFLHNCLRTYIWIDVRRRHTTGDSCLLNVSVHTHTYTYTPTHTHSDTFLENVPQQLASTPSAPTQCTTTTLAFIWLKVSEFLILVPFHCLFSLMIYPCSGCYASHQVASLYIGLQIYWFAFFK